MIFVASSTRFPPSCLLRESRESDCTRSDNRAFLGSKSSDIVGAEAFFTIDIGRIVLADKIVLKFADEENGDPFLLFDVFTSDGVNHGSVDPKIESPEYLKVFSMLRPNKTQREFEIDLTRFNNNAEQEKRLVSIGPGVR